MKRRLIGNGLANAGSIFWITVLQIVTVPVLVHAWGVNAYGVWLMITTIPTYFALSDLGFAAAATSDMTIAFARGERHRVVVTFQSVLLLGVAISAAALTRALPLNVWFGSNVGILPGVTIGYDALAGIAAVVSHDVLPRWLGADVLAKTVRNL